MNIINNIGKDLDKKKSSKSLFTEEQLRKWCNNNKFIYVEESDIWYFKPNFNNDGSKIEISKTYNETCNSKCIKYNDGICWIYKRWPFYHGLRSGITDEQICENLLYSTLEWKILYETVWIYDIVDTTLDYQALEGKFYSKIACACISYKNEPQTESIHKDLHPDCHPSHNHSLSIIRNLHEVYDLQTDRYVKPIWEDNYAFCKGFEKT